MALPAKSSADAADDAATCRQQGRRALRKTQQPCRQKAWQVPRMTWPCRQKGRRPYGRPSCSTVVFLVFEISVSVRPVCPPLVAAFSGPDDRNHPPAVTLSLCGTFQSRFHLPHAGVLHRRPAAMFPAFSTNGHARCNRQHRLTFFCPFSDACAITCTLPMPQYGMQGRVVAAAGPDLQALGNPCPPFPALPGGGGETSLYRRAIS